MGGGSRDLPPQVESFKQATLRFHGQAGVIPIHPFSFFAQSKGWIFFEPIQFPNKAAYLFKKVPGLTPCWHRGGTTVIFICVLPAKFYTAAI
jgi:hypothetical protein